MINTEMLLILITLTLSYKSHIHIWEPKSLLNLYNNRKFPYVVMNFGNIPYGHTVIGTVFKATPFGACEPLRPIKWDKNN